MSWEQFWNSISNVGNLSLIIIVIAALLYYFGKLIGDIKVAKYERIDYYIEGLFFSLIYIAFPFAVVLLITGYTNFYLSFWPSLIFQYIILGCLWLSGFAHEYLRRHGAISFFEKLFHEKIEQLKKQRQLIATVEEKLKNSTDKNLTNIATLAFYDFPIKIIGNQGTLLLFSVLILWSAYSCISPETIFQPASIFLSILTFINLTFLALVSGYKTTHYPQAKITLENGNQITGKILKFGEFVYLLKENEEKKLFLNKDKIVCIEESLYKEKIGDLEPSESKGD